MDRAGTSKTACTRNICGLEAVLLYAATFGLFHLSTVCSQGEHEIGEKAT